MCEIWAMTIEKFPGRSILPGPPRPEVGVIQCSSALRVAAPELEEHQPELLAGIRQSGVLPIDHTHRAARRAQHVVGKQVAVTRLQIGRPFEQLLQRHELVAQAGQLPGEWGARQ